MGSVWETDREAFLQFMALTALKRIFLVKTTAS